MSVPAASVERSGRARQRPGAVLALAAGTPLGVGATGAAALLPHVACPLRALTGVPCPLCGATRSVLLATHGDAGFLALNPVWVAVLAVLALAGAALVVADARGADVAALRARVPTRVASCVAAFVVAAGWVCALAHRQAIAGA